jgi:hypothetical protein
VSDPFWSDRFHWCVLAAGFLAASEGRLDDSASVRESACRWYVSPARAHPLSASVAGPKPRASPLCVKAGEAGADGPRRPRSLGSPPNHTGLSSPGKTKAVLTFEVCVALSGSPSKPASIWALTTPPVEFLKTRKSRTSAPLLPATRAD